MEYINLGKSGLKVSRIALGCMTYGSPSWQAWVLDEAASTPIIAKALDLGVNFLDTADMYSIGASEEILGRFLKPFPRHKLVIASKAYNPMSEDVNDRGLSRKHIFEALDASLKRLKTDYLDLYQIHRFDYQTPLEETLDALNDVVRSGKVRYLGASSMHAWQFMKALGLQRQHGWAPFVSMQPHYNLIYREEEREMLPLCRAEGIGVIPWSPLARGRLAGKGREQGQKTVRAGSDASAIRLYEATREQDEAIIEAVAAAARRHNKSMAQIGYAWIASRPGVTAPVIGASRVEQLVEAVESLEIKLTPEDVEAMEKPYRTRPTAGHQ
ncbi:aldo/keto reductase [Terrarubrum flagellatum]|uniref:aldo/keto reductase n=1 Tax=Terrirubrum flagellatum TaxID=2895980 RepID=UPI003145177A